MKRLTVYAVPDYNSTVNHVLLFRDKKKAENRMAFGKKPIEETLIYNETLHEISDEFVKNNCILAYQAWDDGKFTDWYMTAKEACNACQQEKKPEAWMCTEGLLI